MMTNTECNSSLLFIKYIYYTVQVEFCYNVAHMCRASCSLVELCSLQCVLSKFQVPSEEVWQYHGVIYYCLLKHCGYNNGQVH